MTTGTTRSSGAGPAETRAELLRIGFPPAALEHAARARAAGLFLTEPPADLLGRTLERCRAALAEPRGTTGRTTSAERLADIVAAYRMAAADVEELMAPETTHMGALAHVGLFASECAAAADQAGKTRGRPIVVVDNHDVVRPSWWTGDTGFGAMHAAIRSASSTAIRAEGAPSAVVMVLHSDVGSYGDDDLQALGALLARPTSDLWLVPRELAERYKGLEVMVVGDRTHTLQGPCPTPWATMQSFDRDARFQAAEVRTSVEALTAGIGETWPAVEVRLDPMRDIRSLLERVVSSGHGVKVAATRSNGRGFASPEAVA